MSHRIIISAALQSALNAPEVQAQLSSSQQARVASICNDETQPPCDDNLHYLLRTAGKAYSQED